MLTELTVMITSHTHTHTHIRSSCCIPKVNTKLHVNYISMKLGKKVEEWIMPLGRVTACS